MQTVLLPLALADAPSHVTIQGGANNLAAPAFEFIDRAFLPLLRRMGYNVAATLTRPGFYRPAAARSWPRSAPPEEKRPLELMERGALIERKGEAIVATLAYSIACREADRLRAFLNWPQVAFSR